MKRQELIEIIAKYLESINYERNTNYEEYSMADLIKVCRIYKIDIKNKPDSVYT
jgi:hypothetical protein